nr:hypothetical protein [uncultured bacterium]
MPYTENKGTKIYWEEHGAGEPLILVMGLASTLDFWHRTVPVMAPRFRTIVYDNRGVGRSDVPPPGYSIKDMADDLAAVMAVMRAAEIERARIYGISMGGMIAQEFALNYPDRVQALVLGCTNFGGRGVKAAAPQVLEVLKNRGQMTPQEAAWAMAPHTYDKNTPRELVEEDIAIRAKWFPTAEGYFGQLGAVLSWEGRPRLSQLQLRLWLFTARRMN